MAPFFSMSAYPIRRKSSRYATGVHLVLISAIALGIGFRLINLDQKVYWTDEVYTSLRISGYTSPEAVAELYTGRVLSLKDLQKSQRLNPEKPLSYTLQGLAREEPQIVPFYFILARGWAALFGSSVAAIRALSAVIGILAIPLMYSLCRELFDSSLAGKIGAALVALSPFHVLYAQEARFYSLFTVTILLSSYTLLIAIRRPTRLNWSLYAVTVAIALYSHLFAILVIAGNTLYTTLRAYLAPHQPRKRIPSQVIANGLATSAGILLFLPWLFILIVNQNAAQSTTQWAADPLSAVGTWVRFLGNLSRLFLDLGFGVSNTSFLAVAPLVLPILLISILVGYALYFVYRHTSAKIGLFVLTLTGTTLFGLGLPDLILGSNRIATARYLIATYLGVQMAIAYLFATQLFNPSLRPRHQQFWRILATFILAGNLLSCSLSASAQVWWNKRLEDTRYLPTIAHIIQQSQHPLIINDSSYIQIQSLGHLLPANVQFLLPPKGTLPQIPPGYTEVFLFMPSTELQQQLLQTQPDYFQSLPNTGDLLFKAANHESIPTGDRP